MLAALEHGAEGRNIPGGTSSTSPSSPSPGMVWFRLIDKVYAERNLRAAWAKVRANDGAAGVDHQSLAMFEQRLDANLAELAQQLRDGSYRPQPVRRVYIPKPGGGQRPLGIPAVRDRVVQQALRHVLEPIFERDFATHSYGFRPGTGCKDALRRVDELLGQGYGHVVDADLTSYFDTIPHERLMQLVRQKVADGRVLKLIESFLTQGVMDGLDQWAPAAAAGSPQGAVVSPLLSNIYLDPLDHLMAAAGFQMVRYADDFVILCRSESEARAALDRVRQWTAQAGLALHPDKTRVVDARTESFQFLGYHFERGRKWPRAKSLGKFRDAIRSATRRTSGRSLPRIIAEDLNPKLRGWFGYFKHSYKTTFPYLDGWIRMRLRSILRKRHRGKGRGRGRDHQRWPNAYFAGLGLFSLTAAHRLACQSVVR